MVEAMKSARQKSGLSQKTLADRIGVTEQYVYYIENGHRRPSVNVAKKIAAELDFNWMEFYGESDNDRA